MNVDTIACTIEMETLLCFLFIYLFLAHSLPLNGVMCTWISFGLVEYAIGRDKSQDVMMYNIEGGLHEVYIKLYWYILAIFLCFNLPHLAR